MTKQPQKLRPVEQLARAEQSAAPAEVVLRDALVSIRRAAAVEGLPPALTAGLLAAAASLNLYVGRSGLRKVGR